MFASPNGSSAGENDNSAMMFFLKERVETLQAAVNPDAGIILVHHTKKLSKQQVKDDPFLALSGASALRGYYTSGLILHRPDDDSTAAGCQAQPVSDPWADIDPKIRQANKHHAELSRLYRDVIENGTAEFEVRIRTDDPNTCDIYVHNLPVMGEDFALLIGDILTNTRAALDHLAWQLVKRFSDKSPDRSTTWPIHEAPYKVEDLRKVAPTSSAISRNSAKSSWRGYADQPAMMTDGLCSRASERTSSMSTRPVSGTTWYAMGRYSLPEKLSFMPCVR